MKKEKGGPPPREAATKACACWSGLPYAECCAPFHRGDREAPDPVALMRSRYAAFALGEAEYLIHTLAVSHPDLAAPRAELLRALRGHGGRLRYRSLSILDHRRSARAGEVLFAAGLTEGARDQSFVELSDFEHDGQGWRYASGILMPSKDLGRPAEGLTIDTFLELASAH